MERWKAECKTSTYEINEGQYVLGKFGFLLSTFPKWI
jgi:hypothetical protein